MLSAIPAYLYLSTFSGELSNHHSRWGEFGSFAGGIFSPIISILAFIGLLYSIDITKRQFQTQSEEGSFFTLINLHLAKVQHMKLENHDGYEVFKLLSEKYRELYKEDCFNYARFAFIKNINNLPNKAYQFIVNDMNNDDKCTWATDEDKSTVVDYFNLSEDKDELLKRFITGETSGDKKDKVIKIGQLVFEDADSEYRIKKLKVLYEEYYDSYGHLVGHYFRNIYYVLKHIEDMKYDYKYSRIFRAQLSRYELAIMFYNIMSDYTSDDFNRLIFKYNILDDLYGADLCYHPYDEKLAEDLESRKQNKLTSS